MRRFRWRLVAAAIASAVTALVAGGIAWAQIPATDGTITACYNKSGGALNVVDTSATQCGKHQTQLQWNQHGPTGSTGPIGSTGPAGGNGATGPTGPSVSTDGLMHGSGTVSQSGLITVDPGSEVFLADVGDMGGLWGECANAKASHIRVFLKTSSTLPRYLFVSSSVTSLGFGAHDEEVTPNADAISTAQIASGVETATITASQFVFDAAPPAHCLFSVQTIFSHG